MIGVWTDNHLWQPGGISIFSAQLFWILSQNLCEELITRAGHHHGLNIGSCDWKPNALPQSYVPTLWLLMLYLLYKFDDIIRLFESGSIVDSFGK